MYEAPPLFVLFYGGAFIIALIGGLQNLYIWFRAGNSEGAFGKITSAVFSLRIGCLVKAFIASVMLKSRLIRRSTTRGVLKAAFILCYLTLILAYHVKANQLPQLEAVHPFIVFFYAPFADYYFLRDASPGTFTATDAFYGLINDLFAAYIVCFEAFAISRRFIAKKVPIQSTLEDVLADALLGLWFVFRFAAEVATILAFGVPATIAQYWFVAYGFSILLAPTGLPWGILYDVLWPLSGLFFGMLIAYIPFSKLWHLLVAPLSILRGSLLEEVKREEWRARKPSPL